MLKATIIHSVLIDQPAIVHLNYLVKCKLNLNIEFAVINFEEVTKGSRIRIFRCVPLVAFLEI